MFMIQDDVCDTGLALGLRHGGRRSGEPADHHRRRDAVSSLSNPALLEPSLTLSLSDDARGMARPKVEANRASEERGPARVSSPNSTVSSAYPSSIKREKDAAAEEAEVERISSRVSDDDDDEGGARKKLRLTKEQSALLEDRFKEHSTLNPKQKQALAKQLNLRPRQVEVWFQNRRARTKLKQTEVDCEFLKRCCEALTDENQRLQKELQELRALKFAPPPPPSLYMQLPAATLSMCPSCERICGGEGHKGGRPGPFVVAAKPHFFNPFTHPAAC